MIAFFSFKYLKKEIVFTPPQLSLLFHTGVCEAYIQYIPDTEELCIFIFRATIAAVEGLNPSVKMI